MELQNYNVATNKLQPHCSSIVITMGLQWDYNLHMVVFCWLLTLVIGDFYDALVDCVQYVDCLILHAITLYYTTLHYTTLHYITLHYITLHCITLHYITYITLHYITLHTLHKYTHTYIRAHIHHITCHYII